MRYAISLSMIIAGLLTSFTAQGADDNFELSLNEHKFTPSELTVPADKRIKLTIKNLDASAAEFESHNYISDHSKPAHTRSSTTFMKIRPRGLSSRSRGKMLAALLVVFREVIEAGLIVGIVLAATKGVPRRGLWVCYGVAGGIAGACLVAAFADQIAPLFAGSGQELFNASILFLAV